METPLNMSLTPSGPSPNPAVSSLSAQSSIFSSSNLFQNAAGFNIIGGQFVSGDVHEHRTDSISGVGNANLSIPSFSIMDDTFSESEVYCNQLMRRRRGFPLYVPGPPENLSAEYRRHGVAIGDVGSITPEGIFDFCFNIYLPADHPINDNDVPENFQPLMPYASKDLTSLAYAPGNSALTSSVQKLDLSPFAEFPGGNFVFNCGAPQGAVLALPHGSYLKKLKNLELVREYVATHAESWYKHINGARGRGLQNGSLYLVTGCEKAYSWGMASFYSTNNEFQLEFRATPRADSSIRYQWGGIHGCRDPSQHKSYDPSPKRNIPLNQTTFIHGLSISLGIGIWGKLFGKVGIREIVESRLGSANGNGNMSLAPGSSLFSWALGLPWGGGSIGGKSCAGENGNVVLSDFPPVVKIFHPAEIINDYLLRKIPNATVVMSHDDDWRDILADDPSTGFPVQSVSELLRKIDDEFSITIKDGVTFLRANPSPARDTVITPVLSRVNISTTADTGTAYFAKRSPSTNTLTLSSARVSRNRSVLNSSASSSALVLSPETYSTNPSASTSTSSLLLPSKTAQVSGPVQSQSRPASPAASVFDETVRILAAGYVLAMHDFAPQHQNATFLSFRAGQVIHVLNRDSSGWWDGELEGRRGWFPSNYVNSDVNALVDEEPVASPTPRVQGHVRASSSVSSAASWVARSSPRPSLSRRPSLSEALGPDIDSYCPPIMVPLLHGLSLLQSAVRANRVSHFQPSTAGIISCVRSVLSATDTLVRDAPILHRFPALAQERRRILSVLASLVAQAKKASDETPDEENQEAQVDDMVRLGGQVFVSVRRFLAVAVQCGVELPERRQSVGSLPGSTDTEGHWWSNSDSLEARTVFYGHGTSGSYGLDGILGRTPTPRRVVLADQGSALRSRSMVDLRRSSRASAEDDFDSAVPLLPNGINIPAKTEQEQDLFKERVLRHKASVLSVSSTSSSSSYSSLESTSTPARPSFPVGSSSTAQVMDALRSTHDQYLSTITAFIGHAHSHSRTSHASSTGHMYELVREIVEMVCKLLTIVDAVLQHPDVPANKLGNLQAAKDGLYNVTSTLAESVHLLTVAVDPTKSEEDEKQTLLRSATGALKSGADCVAAVKMCLNRSLGERPFVLLLPNDVERMSFTPSKFAPETALVRASSIGALNMYRFSGIIEEENVVRQRAYMYPVIPENRLFAEESSWSVSSGISSKSSSMQSQETGVTSPNSSLLHLAIAKTMVDPSLPSPTSLEGTDGDGTTWEGSRARATEDVALEAKIFHGDLPAIPLEPILQHPVAWMLSHDYSLEDVAYNTEGHLVGATMDVLVEKMTPHDSIIDPAFSAVFFLTFRLFSSPIELVDTIIQRYNLVPPDGISAEDVQLWQQCKGIPVRLRVSNFIKIWVEIYWRPGVDDSALEPLATFTQNGLAVMFPGRAQRIKDLIELRRQTAKSVISPKSERTRDPGMSINPPSATVPVGEIPRPLMTKTLLANLRAGNFVTIAITDFDPLELARQLTIMECNLYCAIQPEEVLETGQEGVKPPLNVKAVSSLSTAITGWVAESILSEPDIKKRTQLIKFFIKVADRCTSLNNYSTPRSMLAALDSSTISRLHQTWLGLPQKNRSQLVALRRLADHSRNYHEYRSKLRNTAPPAVPFLGLYLTDVTFCREGNPSHRASPMNPERKLLNFNKYHKLARIVQDMQRFQVPYHLRPIPEVQQYLTVDFNKAKHHGDLQDLYRRSLLVEPRQAADTAAPDMQQLFGWTTPSQATTPS